MPAETTNCRVGNCPAETSHYRGQDLRQVRDSGTSQLRDKASRQQQLEKIEMLKGADNEYNLDYAVTETQKTILNAFGMTADNIHRQARGISADLARIETEAFEKQAAEREEGSV
jgi:hypothetical protein